MWSSGLGSECIGIPVDSGTAAVMLDGLRMLYDPKGSFSQALSSVMRNDSDDPKRPEVAENGSQNLVFPTFLTSTSPPKAAAELISLPRAADDPTFGDIP